jgi:hypothetical protein
MNEGMVSNYSVGERCYLLRPETNPQIVIIVEACAFIDRWRYEVAGDAFEEPHNTTLWTEDSLRKFKHIAADQSFTQLLDTLKGRVPSMLT